MGQFAFVGHFNLEVAKNNSLAGKPFIKIQKGLAAVIYFRSGQFIKVFRSLNDPEFARYTFPFPAAAMQPINASALQSIKNTPALSTDGDHFTGQVFYDD